MLELYLTNYGNTRLFIQMQVRQAYGCHDIDDTYCFGLRTKVDYVRIMAG